MGEELGKDLKRASMIMIFTVLSMLILSGTLMKAVHAEDFVLDWPLWIYPTSTGGDQTIDYTGFVSDEWVSESWHIPVDLTGMVSDTLHITIQHGDTRFSVSDVILIVALTPAAHSAITAVDVSPSREGSKSTSSFRLVDGSSVPRGIELNQHIYKDAPPAQCYFYEFHVANSLGFKGSTSLPDHIDLAVALHMKTGILNCDGMRIHFDCSAIVNSNPRAIGINLPTHDTTAWQSIVLVIPESPLGSIMATASMIIAFGAFFGLRRRKPQITSEF